MYIVGLEDLKFNRKDFVQRMKHEDGFGARVMGVLQPYFDALLGDKPKLNLNENDSDVFDITDLPANVVVDDAPTVDREVVEHVD